MSAWISIDFGHSANPLINGGGLFLNGELLTDIVFPEGYNQVPYGPFDGYAHLESITLPKGITTIIDFAFSGCKSLTSVTLPGSLKSIGRSAFYGCSNLSNVYYSGAPWQLLKLKISAAGNEHLLACSFQSSPLDETILETVIPLLVYGFILADLCSSLIAAVLAIRQRMNKPL